jgi:aryl-alcohol dehydrogenase-like predicted oxidoreductase
MEYTTLGSTGAKVSRICLGCLTFGSSEWREWTLDEPESREIIERAIDLGINFFDTANTYGDGMSEEVVGNILGEYNRDRFVLNSKVYYPMDENNPNSGGLSRKAIEQELQNSLDRLGMDTIDLYQIHQWDFETPIEQTLRALDDAVSRGQVRYIGASKMWAHQFAEALHTSERLGLERFQTMQNHYNLVYREEEREMIPYCDKNDIGVIPFSPLARGYLTRPHDQYENTARGKEDPNTRNYSYMDGGGPEINERVEEMAADKGASMAQIALAWLLHKDEVTAPIIGTTSIEHLEDSVEALDISLSDSDMEYLEEPYEPVEVSGHGPNPDSGPQSH